MTGPLTFGSLFAGIGGFDLGFERAGMVCKWQVEIDDYANKVLAKHWPNVRRWPDVRTWPQPDTARVDVICGGFPCQDISNAGKRAGITGERSGLWSEYVRIVRLLRPRFVVVENVAALLIRGIDRVLGDLAESGFDAEWDCIPACAFGAPHSRERVFLVAHSNKERCWRWRGGMRNKTRCDHWKATQDQREWKDVERWLRTSFPDCHRDASDPETFGVSHGIPRELECGVFGNAVVPQVAEWIGRRIVESVECET